MEFLDRIKNIRTTVAGIVVSAITVLTQIHHAVDSDPTTTMSVEQIVVSVTAIGAGLALLFARD